MKLRTLGELGLDGFDFKQTRPLLLLAYLCLEGTQERRQLAELFWPQSKNASSNLTTVLSRINKLDSSLIVVERQNLSTRLACDALSLLEAFEQNDYLEVIKHYEGRFLAGFYLKGMDAELEEWLFKTRESLASKVQQAKLNLAEQKASKGLFQEAAIEAEQAYLQASAKEPSERDLERFYKLLIAGGNTFADEVKKEARTYNLELSYSKEQAQLEVAEAWGFEVSVVNSRTEAPANYGEEISAVRPTASFLPSQNSSFIGRLPELKELLGLLVREDIRLLTLLGSGGMGKTRLAERVAEECEKERVFSEGCFFVELEALTNPEMLPSAIANALAMNLGTHKPILEQLIEELEQKQTLLVLDNFEHLLEAATLCTRLLASCPQLKILVTSRERLHIQHEWVFRMQGLQYPKEACSFAEAKAFDALNLFVSQAQKQQHRFRLEESNHNDVQTICRLLEGLPLGLKLAASWLNTVPIDEIANEIASGIDILESQQREVSERHRSIRATLDYSWNLLQPHEQDVLKKLSIFVGGFTREAANAVSDVRITILAKLIDKSFIRLEGSRYSIHPLVNQFLSERLEENKEDYDETQKKHSHYFLDYLSKNAETIWLPGQENITGFIIAYLPNFKRAWISALQSQDFAIHKDASFTFQLAFGRTNRFIEGMSFYTEALKLMQEASDEPSGLSLHFKLDLAWLQLQNGQLTDAQNIYEGILLNLEKAKEYLGLARALNGLASIYERNGSFSKAKEILADSLAALKRFEVEADNLHKLLGRSVLLRHLGSMEEALGNFDVAYAHFKQALEIDAKAASQPQQIRDKYYLARLLLAQKNYDAAVDICTEALRETLAAGMLNYSVPHYLYLGMAHLRLANFEAANTNLNKALNIITQNKQLLYRAEAHCQLGITNLHLGNDSLALYYFTSALQTSKSMQLDPLVAEVLVGCCEWFTQKKQWDIVEAVARVVTEMETARIEHREAAKSLMEAHKPNFGDALINVNPYDLQDRLIEEFTKVEQS